MTMVLRMGNSLVKNNRGQVRWLMCGAVTAALSTMHEPMRLFGKVFLYLGPTAHPLDFLKPLAVKVSPLLQVLVSETEFG